MIKVTRKKMSQELVSFLSARSEQLIQHLASGESVPNAILESYRNPNVKLHLIDETYGKCVYCESKITHVYWGDVEHIRPKSVFPEARLDIDNLTLACAPCNNAKGDYWHDEYSIIDPYIDMPTDEVFSLGYFVARLPGRDRARITIEKLQLNRQALIERRRERIELLQPLADQFAIASPGPLKELLRDQLLKQAADDSEYAMTIKTFLRAACNIE